MPRMIDADELLTDLRITHAVKYGNTSPEQRHMSYSSFLAYEVADAIRDAPTIDPELITGETSDGYHTFNELYHHRGVLFSVICNARPDIAWKARKHHDGTMYDDMFIVGIETPDGQATYHYYVDPYWDMFRVKALEYAPEWDGHTPAQAIERIGRIDLERHAYWIQHNAVPLKSECSACRTTYNIRMEYNLGIRYCPHCKAKMDKEDKPNE